MRFTDKIKYNIKLALPIAVIAGAGLMASCDKDDDVPQRDVEVTFGRYTGDECLALPILQKYIDDPSVRYVYMTILPDDWGTFSAGNIRQMRRNFLQPRIEMSPKMRGRGDFTFPVGLASQFPEDSLWYTKQGWTINKRLQKQK